jgi:hypothetical protein
LAPFAPFAPFAPAPALSKYSNDPFGSAFIVLEPSVQFAGQTSPYLSCVSRKGEKEEERVSIWEGVL